MTSARRSLETIAVRLSPILSHKLRERGSRQNYRGIHLDFTRDRFVHSICLGRVRKSNPPMCCIYEEPIVSFPLAQQQLLKAIDLPHSRFFDVINGKLVFAPLHDIQEVKNVYQAYEQIAEYNPLSLDDFLNAHRFITDNLVAEAGQFRTVGVAVVNSKREILHSGANFTEVPALVSELFEWAKTTDTHKLIKSSAVHFMIEHIHPFRDGNGRIGRLWQTLIRFAGQARNDRKKTFQSATVFKQFLYLQKPLIYTTGIKYFRYFRQ